MGNAKNHQVTWQRGSPKLKSSTPHSAGASSKALPTHCRVFSLPISIYARGLKSLKRLSQGGRSLCASEGAESLTGQMDSPGRRTDLQHFFSACLDTILKHFVPSQDYPGLSLLISLHFKQCSVTHLLCRQHFVALSL